MKDLSEQLNIQQSNDDEGKFVVKKISKLEELANGTQKEIPESDITIQTDKELIQLCHVENEKEHQKFIIKPGMFVIEDGMNGTVLKKSEVRQYNLLETIDNTSMIFAEANKFFGKLDVYKELGRDPKRCILICSPPGVGKTASISKVCETLLKEEGTCVVMWDTTAIRSSVANRFFLYGSKFSSKVKRFILVIEDITGGTEEDSYGPRGEDSSMLNLLDGMVSPFKIPTFIISTTNNPEKSVGALIDRPGRFDKVLELKTPNESQSISLLAFLAKRDITEEEKAAAKKASKEGFSIAHLQEVVVRSMIDDIPFMEVVDQLVAHKKRFKEGFQEVKNIGIGIK